MPRVPCVVLTALIAAGCATTPTGAPQAISRSDVKAPHYVVPAPDKYPVTVTRDAGLLGAMCKIDIVIGPTTIARLSASERITLHLPEGHAVIAAKTVGFCGGELRQARAEVQAGRQIGFRVGFGANGDLFITPAY